MVPAARGVRSATRPRDRRSHRPARGGALHPELPARRTDGARRGLSQGPSRTGRYGATPRATRGGFRWGRGTSSPTSRCRPVNRWCATCSSARVTRNGWEGARTPSTRRTPSVTRGMAHACPRIRYRRRRGLARARRRRCRRRPLSLVRSRRTIGVAVSSASAGLRGGCGPSRRQSKTSRRLGTASVDAGGTGAHVARGRVRRRRPPRGPSRSLPSSRPDRGARARRERR